MKWVATVNYGEGLPTDTKEFGHREPADVMRAVASDWISAQTSGGISMGDTAAFALKNGYAPTITVTLQAVQGARP